MKRAALLLIGCMLCSGCSASGGYGETVWEDYSAAPDGTFGNEDGFSNECSITLGEMISVRGGGALIEGSRVSITEGGVYIISGELKNGSVAVESDKPVKLILNGAAVYGGETAIRSGGSLIVESAEGTENFLSAADTAVYAEDSLTLCGAGALSISSDGGRGISAGGDIMMNGGTVLVFGSADGGALGCGEGHGITVSGGALLALGNAERTEKPANCLFETIRAKAGSVVSVENEDGETLLSIPVMRDAQTAFFANGENPAGLRIAVEEGNALSE